MIVPGHTGQRERRTADCIGPKKIVINRPNSLSKLRLRQSAWPQGSQAHARSTPEGIWPVHNMSEIG
jgi:hypothetical protein